MRRRKEQEHKYNENKSVQLTKIWAKLNIKNELLFIQNPYHYVLRYVYLGVLYEIQLARWLAVALSLSGKINFERTVYNGLGDFIIEIDFLLFSRLVVLSGDNILIPDVDCYCSYCFIALLQFIWSK